MCGVRKPYVFEMAQSPRSYSKEPELAELQQLELPVRRAELKSVFSWEA
jgi:hypothetical protein